MNASRPLVMISAGGTGGHVYPGLAVALELTGRDYSVAWIGTRHGMEHQVVPASGIDIYYLPVKGVRGKSVLSKLQAFALVFFALLRALWLLFKHRPACVIGLGGYVSGPAGMAAWLSRTPLLIQEQNSVAGTTNRMLARFADRIASGFSGAFAGTRRDVVTGNPLRRDIVEAGEAAVYTYDGERPLRLLILGGSQGARAINDAVPGALRRLLREGHDAIEVWHQTGEANFPIMRQRYAGIADATVQVEPFISDMAAVYQWADLVLCRAGALTVAELAVTGRPSVLVPLPQAIDDHQRRNARTLVDAGAGVILEQEQLDGYYLSRLLRELMDQPDRLAAMSAAALRVGKPDATNQVCDLCEELIDG